MDTSGEIAALATAGATVLITAMITDAWNEMRPRIGRVFGRGRPAQQHGQLERLERDRNQLQQLPEAARDEQGRVLAAQWSVRLLDLIEADSDAAATLRELVSSWHAEHPTPADGAGGVRQQARAEGHARITQIGGSQITIRPERS